MSKEGHCFVAFVIESAVLRILIGLGEVVAHLNIMKAFGWFDKKV